MFRSLTFPILQHFLVLILTGGNKLVTQLKHDESYSVKYSLEVLLYDGNNKYVL